MAYFRKRNYKKPATPRTPRATPRKMYKKKMYPTTLAKRVNAIIARNVENKMSVSSSFENPVMTWIATDPVYFLASYNNFFNMAQGTAQNQRVGNQIRLKRWIVKGFVTPCQSTGVGPDPQPYDLNGFTGTVKLMLLKTRNDQGITSDLTRLLQSGATAISPTGTQFDILYPINKDLYKVYWTRTFKCGCSTSTATNSTTDFLTILPNNDYKMQHSFGLDICKYIGMNAKITYNDSTSQAILPASMNNICIVAIWSPFTGDMTQSSYNYQTFFKVSMVSHFEYEDA
nr:MAG: capsid protein [Cressdnaviricota sp.]